MFIRGNIYEIRPCACECVKPTCEVPLREEMLDKVCVGREEQVVQLVHAHADGGVDVQPPTQVGAERLHLAWAEGSTKSIDLGYWFLFLVGSILQETRF